MGCVKGQIMKVKVGDFVTVLPYGVNKYLVLSRAHKATDPIDPADGPFLEVDLGPLWELYSEEMGISEMHEKWMQIIFESEVSDEMV